MFLDERSSILGETEWREATALVVMASPGPMLWPPNPAALGIVGSKCLRVVVADIQLNGKQCATPVQIGIRFAIADQGRDVPSTVAMVAAVMATRSEARSACSRSLARSWIRRSIKASRFCSSTASASN